MGINEIYNYMLLPFDNPVSKGVLDATKSFLGVEKKLDLPKGVTTVVTKVEALPLWQQASQNGPFIRIAGVFGAAAVAMGAYGAHILHPKDKAAELKEIFETGNKIHFMHTLALFGVPLTKYPKISGSLIIVGTVLFAGPCYYHGITGENRFGRFAPIGGSVLLLGWLSMVL